MASDSGPVTGHPGDGSVRFSLGPKRRPRTFIPTRPWNRRLLPWLRLQSLTCEQSRTPTLPQRRAWIVPLLSAKRLPWSIQRFSPRACSPAAAAMLSPSAPLEAPLSPSRCRSVPPAAVTCPCRRRSSTLRLPRMCRIPGANRRRPIQCRKTARRRRSFRCPALRRGLAFSTDPPLPPGSILSQGIVAPPGVVAGPPGSAR